MKAKITNNVGNKDFDWSVVEKEHKKKKRVPNPAVLEKHNDVIYSHETYALDMYEAIFLSGGVESKEVTPGETREIIDIVGIKGMEVQAVLRGMIDCTLDFKNEKMLATRFGKTPKEFVDMLHDKENAETFIRAKHVVAIESIEPFTRGSISQGFIKQTKSEFFEQLKNTTTAYMCKLLEKNGGGFLVDVQGVHGFLPGSLAATNIVRDFDSMIGKEIPVVVEDYLKESNTFVFSYKKYVRMVLPSKIDELLIEKERTGTVTGVTKFGIFIEFDDIFTGLLHTSKMTEGCKKLFDNGEFKPGNVFERFWVKEVTPDKKLILTDEDPTIKIAEMAEFTKNNVGTIKGGKVVAIQPFGTLVKIQKDICGLISQKEIKSKGKKMAIGDVIMVSIDSVKRDKVFLSLPAES